MLFFGIVGSVLMAWFLQKSVNDAPDEAVFATENIQQATSSLDLPLAIPGTTLLATKISSYDGPFLEDGSG